MTKDEAKKELEFYKNLAIKHETVIKGCDEKIIELQAIINKPDKWQDSLVQPDKEDYFYLRNSLSEGLVVGWSSLNEIKSEYAFKTEEQAELIKEKALLMQEMYAFAHVRNEGWMPDWKNPNKKKFGIEYYAYGGLEVTCKRGCVFFIFGVVVKSIEIAGEMLEIFGERIEKFYNKQY